MNLIDPNALLEATLKQQADQPQNAKKNNKYDKIRELLPQS